MSVCNNSIIQGEDCPFWLKPYQLVNDAKVYSNWDEYLKSLDIAIYTNPLSPILFSTEIKEGYELLEFNGEICTGLIPKEKTVNLTEGEIIVEVKGVLLNGELTDKEIAYPKLMVKTKGKL